MDAVTDTTRLEPKPDLNPFSIVTPVPLPSLMPFQNFFVTSSSQLHFSVSVNLVAARRAVAEAAATTLLGLLLDNVDNVDGDSVELFGGSHVSNHNPPRHQHLGPNEREMGAETYAQVLEQVLGLGVDVQLARLGVLGEVEGGDLGDVLILALTLLLLELEGDTADGTLLNTLHQVGGVAGNLVAQALYSTCQSPAMESDTSGTFKKTKIGKLGRRVILTGSNDGDLIAYTFAERVRPLVSKGKASVGCRSIHLVSKSSATEPLAI